MIGKFTAEPIWAWCFLSGKFVQPFACQDGVETSRFLHMDLETESQIFGFNGNITFLF